MSSSDTDGAEGEYQRLLSSSERPIDAESTHLRNQGYLSGDNTKDESLDSTAVGKVYGQLSRSSSMKEILVVPRSRAVSHVVDNDTFQLNHTGLNDQEVIIRRAKYGYNELPDKRPSKWKVFLKLNVQPMACMLWLAAIVEGIIANYPDMAILILIQLANASISFYETNKSGNAVDALKAALKPEATVCRNGIWKSVDAKELVPGDLVKIAAGSTVPADCRLNEGTVQIDQSALTGESHPVEMDAANFHDEGHHPKMGSTVIKGEVDATVEFTGSKTTMGQTAALLEGREVRSNMDKILLKIVRVLVVMSIVMSSVVFFYGYHILKEPLRHTLGFTVVLIVASIPLAIEIVCTTTLAVGSHQLSKRGAIVSRLSSIEDLAGMDLLCSDKTGTLTTNHMEIQDSAFLFLAGETRHTLIQYAAMAAKWNEPPRDALDRLILGPTGADLYDLNASVIQLDYVPFDPVLKRTEATVQITKTGEKFQVTKGAPHVVIHLCTNTEEEKLEMLQRQIEMGSRGIRSLAVARTVNGKWKMIGLLTFIDPPRADSKATIDESRRLGVPVKMITGDNLLIARETCRLLGLSDNVQGPEELPLLKENGEEPDNLARDYGANIVAASGFAQVFPQHKFLIVSTLKAMGYKTGMTGDGVNDAPALKNADVGIAVSGSTDAARAAADIVLTQPGLSTIIDGIIIARGIFQRMQNFLIYRIAASLQLLVFFFIAALVFSPHSFKPACCLEPGVEPDNLLEFSKVCHSFPCKDYNVWPNIFKMPVLLLMLITLLNDGTLITIGYDHVKPSPRPCVWNLRVLFTISSVMALVALVSSLLLLWFTLDSWRDGSLYKLWFNGDAGLTYGEVTTAIYLKVSISDFLTLFSCRCGEDFFWTSKPAPVLMFAAFIALSLSTVIATWWDHDTLDDVSVVGLGRRVPKYTSALIWMYCLFCWFVQDAVKVATYKFMRRFNIFQINSQKSDSSKSSKAL